MIVIVIEIVIVIIVIPCRYLSLPSNLMKDSFLNLMSPDSHGPIKDNGFVCPVSHTLDPPVLTSPLDVGLGRGGGRRLDPLQIKEHVHVLQ